jgi:(p)ppGpp synthase/HD superfamily hydrolase
MNEKILKARQFAIERHGEQKYGELPYIYHLDMVYQIVLDAKLDEDYQIAAYLHDILEDTNTTKEELTLLFGERIARLVDSVTGHGETRKEKKQVMLNKLQALPDGVPLKMADRYANMKESLNIPKLFEMYAKELNDYLPLFEKSNQYLLGLIKELSLPSKKLRC